VAAPKPDLEVRELAERPGDGLQSRARYGRHGRGLGVDYAIPGVVNVRDPHESLGIGKDGVNDSGVVAAPATALKRLNRRPATTVLGERRSRARP
jgi:hypothetical protein